MQYPYSFKHALPSITRHSFALESSAFDLEGCAAATAYVSKRGIPARPLDKDVLATHSIPERETRVVLACNRTSESVVGRNSGMTSPQRQPPHDSSSLCVSRHCKPCGSTNVPQSPLIPCAGCAVHSKYLLTE
jgi:hypothetical protein